MAAQYLQLTSPSIARRPAGADSYTHRVVARGGRTLVSEMHCDTRSGGRDGHRFVTGMPAPGGIGVG